MPAPNVPETLAERHAAVWGLANHESDVARAIQDAWPVMELLATGEIPAEALRGGASGDAFVPRDPEDFGRRHAQSWLESHGALVGRGGGN